MQIDGACHCGAVTFTAQVDPGRVMVCHCTDCQVLSGAPFRAVVAAPYDTLVVSGQTRSYVKVAESGNRRAQVFCPMRHNTPEGSEMQKSRIRQGWVSMSVKRTP